MKRPNPKLGTGVPRYPTLIEARTGVLQWLRGLSAAAVAATSMSACTLPAAEAAERTATLDGGEHSPTRQFAADAGTEMRANSANEPRRKEARTTIDIDFQGVVNVEYLRPHGTPRFQSLMTKRDHFDFPDGEIP